MSNIKNLLHSFFPRSTFAPVQGLRVYPALFFVGENRGRFSMGVLSRTRRCASSCEYGASASYWLVLRPSCNHLAETVVRSRLTNSRQRRRYVSNVSEVARQARSNSNFGYFVRSVVPYSIFQQQSYRLSGATVGRKCPSAPSVRAQIWAALLLVPSSVADAESVRPSL